MHILLRNAEDQIHLSGGVSHPTLASWVFDLDHFRMVEANPAAVRFWEADSREELLQRNFTEVSSATRARLLEMGEMLRRGLVVYDLWTLYPRGRPKTIQCECRAETLPDGRTAMRVTAAAAPPQVDLGLEALRWTEAFRQTPMVVSVYTQDGECLIQNPASILTLGIKPPLLEHVRDRAAAKAALTSLPNSETIRLTAEVQTQRGVRHHDLYLRTTLDPATGNPVVLVQEIDVTEREDARRRLERSEALLSGILSCSTEGVMALVPIREMDDGTGTGPIRDFECRLANPAAERLVGQEHQSLIGRPLSAILNEADAADSVLDRCRTVVETGRRLETAHILRRSGGSECRVMLTAQRLNDGITISLSVLPPLPCPVPDTDSVKPAATLRGLLDRLAATGGLTAEQAALVAEAQQTAALVLEQQKGSAVCSVCLQPCAPSMVPAADAAEMQSSRLERLSAWAQNRGGRVLVVDDSPTNRMVTGAVLGKAGFQVHLAASGEEAVRMVAEAELLPDAVLMDIAMPDMDGVAATTAIRALPGRRGRIPIIAMTAHAFPEDRDLCLKSGLDDYLSKPVAKVDLLAALERWLTPVMP